jgi:hypothetical protein
MGKRTSASITTDGWKGYVTADIADHNTTHETVDHRAHEPVRLDVHRNTVEGVWSVLKRSYHQLSVKHLPDYLDEMPSGSTTGRTPSWSAVRS